MLASTFTLLLALAALFGGIAAIRKDQRFLVAMAGVLFLLGGGLLQTDSLLIKTGEFVVTNTTTEVVGPQGGTETVNASSVSRFIYSDVDENIAFAGQSFVTFLGMLLMLVGVMVTLVGVFVPSTKPGAGVLTRARRELYGR